MGVRGDLRPTLKASWHEGTHMATSAGSVPAESSVQFPMLGSSILTMLGGVDTNLHSNPYSP
jgi:hypothetical protein